jgi:hypothetical protein
VEGFAAARHQPAAALRCSRAALGHAAALGISHAYLRWAWPLAAHDLADTAATTTTTTDLLALLDGYQPGHLARARLASADGSPEAGAALAAAITGLRQHSTPYHLAHGLLDHAQHLLGTGDGEAAEAATGEARSIAGRLGCHPLLDRADTTQPATPHTTAP